MSEGGDRVTDFEKLYSTYFNDVYLYIRRLSGNEHIAEEITSETFFKRQFEFQMSDVIRSIGDPGQCGGLRTLPHIGI